MIRLAFALAAALSLSACATNPQSETRTVTSIAAPQAKVPLRIVGLNDFHGNLEPLRRPITVTETDGASNEVYVAGAAYLASAVAETRKQNEHSLVIAAGDLIGGSPLTSSIFLDEPAIGAMNRIGLDFNAVGNHEFDRGWKELKRVQVGGCEKHTMRETCVVEEFKGAQFAFLAANVMQQDGTTLFPAYGMKSFGDGAQQIKVGVIGLTLKDTPTLVTPSGVAGLTFEDEAASINRAVEQLASDGADAIIVSIHQGLYTEVGYNDKSCGGVSGPLIDILKQVDPRVDLVISGHTHRAYVCDFADIDRDRRFWVTSAAYGGSMLTDILLEVDPAANDAQVIKADNVIVLSENPTAKPGEPFSFPGRYRRWSPDGEVAAYVQLYVDASREAASRPVGRISGPAEKRGGTDETALGNLIADAQLFATREAGAQIALMNNSGIRTALLPQADGTVTYGDIYAVQPFGNTLVTKSFTGAQFLALMEQQFDDEGFVQTFSPSAGFAMTYDMRRAVGSRLISATLDGEAIDPAKTYRVTMNSFLAAGGDSFTVFNDGTEVTVGAIDLDAIEGYLRAVELRELPALGRVVEIR